MFQCKVDGCSEPKHKAKGYCNYHYGRHLSGLPLNVAKRVYDPGAECSVNGCNNISRARGYCRKHWKRWRVHDDPTKTLHSLGYGDGKKWHTSPSGYVVRYEPDNPNAGPNGQVYQHRHVMSQVIGRPLRENENVHHVNGVKDDNRPENLELWTKGQPAGQRVTDKLSWCADFIADNMDAAIRLDPNIADQLKILRRKL